MDKKHNISIQESIKDDYLMISLIPPQNYNSKTNSNICCVVDVSGSMSNQAKITNQSSQNKENYALSILDVVKHSIKMIVNTLGSEDYLSIVTFSDDANVLFGLLPMNDSNKTMAIDKIENLRDEGGTQLWRGLSSALNILLKNQTPNTNQSIFLLTDGQPTDHGIDTNLINFKKANPKLNCTINTFGFSDNSDSELMNKIAMEYNGMFSFIPDASFIATAFANALANTLTVYTNNCLLHITTLENSHLILHPAHSFLLKKMNNLGQQEILIDVGVVNKQQTRDFIFKINQLPKQLNKAYANVKLTYQQSFSLNDYVKSIPLQTIQKNLTQREETEESQIFNHIYRCKVVSAIEASIQQYLKNSQMFQQQIKTKLMNLVDEMEQILSQNDRHFDGIYKDLVRTVSEAFTNESQFKQWGHHYMLSLKRAHIIQQCNTFKDPGVQHYGQNLFKEIRAVADETFCKMPPPKPYSRASSYSQSNTSSNTSYQSAYNMNDYHNYSSGGCIHGDSLVFLQNGKTKKVSEIRKGDVVQCPALGQSQPTEVLCVVVSKCENNTHSFVQVGENLWMTSKHPIRINGEWIYPNKLSEAQQKQSNFIYQFVLKSGHTMNIGGFEVICLGHGFQEPIASHEYLGSQAVINDLMNMKGWQEGKVLITSRLKSKITRKVIAFVQQ
ncbi:hypothetical protein ABPG72_010532 [Tetrahymena utriculariae]